MAGDWIKMRGNLWDDPRVSRICDLTDSTEGPVIGALYWLWATADQHSEDGAMPGLTLRQIDRKTGLAGFAAALCDVGWLNDDPQGVVIQKFEEHNGDSAKKRCQTAKRVANHRAGNAEVTQHALPEEDESVRQALAREEKRREETSTSVPSVEGASKRASRKCPAAFEVDDELRQWAINAHPAVNLQAETEKLRDHTFKSSITDWRGAWRNWIRRADENTPKARGSPTETPHQRHMRERVAQFAPAIAVRAPSERDRPPLEEVFDVTPRALG
jgi:hypothetical protein